ncbi:hypothetical protein ACO8D0_14430 [Streptomyces pratensis]
MTDEERAARSHAIYVRANERAVTRWLTKRVTTQTRQNLRETATPPVTPAQ